MEGLVVAVFGSLARLVSAGELLIPVWFAFTAAERLVVSRDVRGAAAMAARLAGVVATFGAKTALKSAAVGAAASWPAVAALGARPAGAPGDCDALCLVLGVCADSAVLGGFPSGHTATLLYYLASQYFSNCHHQTGHRRLLSILFYSTLGILVGVTRLARECHTLPQVLGGALLGLTMAWLFSFCEEWFRPPTPRPSSPGKRTKKK
ncbi:hypothetical protein Pelo_13866 [Pelomyxa schiedti]|nr:hypothetical protein Pelo_13866 [Pelomyxa schiedti]